ncbi:MAG: hypothetical protein M3R36_19265 [Bacteroidota bacterium]|nr:hypothetical protein [Bacteroidota bacterium]
METTTLNKDIKVLYVTATSFPDGIEEAIKSFTNWCHFQKKENTLVYLVLDLTTE